MVKIMDVQNLNYQKFKNFNVSFDKGLYYLIVGEIDSGKTNLLNLLSGIIPTDNMIFCETFLNKKNRYEFIKNIGVVKRVCENSFYYQKVKSELLEPLNNLGYSKNDSERRIREVLKIFDFEKYLNSKISELTSLEKQELLIIISLLHQPKVLLMDNVLSIFPVDKRIFLIKCLKKMMKHNNMTIIEFSDNLENSLFCDQILLLKKYQIIKNIPKEELYNNDQIFYSNNIEIPFLVDLNIKLRMYGLINKNYDNMKDMVNDIWK